MIPFHLCLRTHSTFHRTKIKLVHASLTLGAVVESADVLPRVRYEQGEQRWRRYRRTGRDDGSMSTGAEDHRLHVCVMVDRMGDGHGQTTTIHHHPN